MSTMDVTNVPQFEPVDSKHYQHVQMISSSMGELSCQDALKEMSKTEEDNHKLSFPEVKKSKVRSMYKHQYIDEQGGAIVIKAARVSLHIPPGALNKRTFISIEVKSAQNCDDSGLDSSTSLTPIVSCQPGGLTFQKKVELILPHCAEFDNIDLHKATARFVRGHVNVSTDSTNKQDQVSCVLKERYCHVYTTHFSDVVVGISDCLKKRMLVVPFSRGSTKLYVKVWIINDLPSEYTILLHEQKQLNFIPFSHTGKFIFENHGQCSLKVQSSLEDKKLEEVSKDIDIQRLFRNIRSEHDFDMGMTASDASPKFVTVSLLKEPVFYLKKEIQGGDAGKSMQEEICASDEVETQHGEVAQTQTESDDIIDQVFTYQTDIFKEIGTLLTDIFKEIGALLPDFPYRLRHHKPELFTKVTSLQPAIFKKISSFSEDIFWKLSPDEREMIKAISSFNTDILDRVSTAQSEMYATLLKDFRYPYYTSRGTYKTIISLHTEIFERISTFIEDTLKMPPLMQADFLRKVKTLELGILGRVDALPKDLQRASFSFWEEIMWGELNPELPTKMATFAAELFQRVPPFYEDFLRLSPMALDDIATKVTMLVRDLLHGSSSFVKDIAQVLLSKFEGRRYYYNEDIAIMIKDVHRGFLTDISTFVKDFRVLMPSFGEDLFTQMSSLEADFSQLMSSLRKDPLTKPFKFSNEPQTSLSSFEKALYDSDKSSSFSSKDPLTKPFELSKEPHKSVSYFKKDFDERSSYLSKEPHKSWSYFKKGGEEESSTPPESKRATAN